MSLAALVALLLVAEEPGRVIPPGQEAVLAAALGKGRALPDGCTWAGAAIEPKFIDAKYACGEAPELLLRFELGPDAFTSTAPSTPLTRDVLAALNAAPLAWKPVLKNDPRPSLALVVPRLAWAVLFVALLVALVQAVRTRAFTRDGLADASLVFVAAFVLRAAVPWGPLDFAEPERLAGLWEGHTTPSAWSSFSVLFEPARLLGFSLGAYRCVGPFLGAATCVLVAVTARRLGASRAAAVIAGLVLATWPVHVRFSASGNPALLAALLWLAVAFFTLREREARSGLELVVLGALVVLCVHARAEGRFVVLPLAVWAWSAPLSFARKLAFLAVLGAALVPYAVENLVPSGSEARFSSGLVALGKTLAARGVTPDLSVLAGLVGLALPGLTRTQRAQLALALGFLLLTACAYGAEDNPLWGHWRYLMPALPFVALGVARAVDALSGRFRRAPAVGLAMALLPLLTFRGVLLRPVDLQEEFQFVLTTAPLLPRDARVVVDVPAQNATGMVHFELTAAMAATLAGHKVQLADETGGEGPRVLYQGLTRRFGARRSLPPEAVGDLLLTERRRVAPLALVMNSQCQPPPPASEAEVPRAPPVFGASLDDCEVELSWIRVR